MQVNPRELSLDDLANLHGTDKGTKYGAGSRHGYAPIYEPYLTKWRDKPIRMLEVGICMEGTQGGHSVMMWHDYFQDASIYTFDIVDMSNSAMMYLSGNRVKFFKGDQSKREDLNAMVAEYGNKKFDFILEDGLHEHEHQMISLGCLFKHVANGGYYILEDITEHGRNACCIRNDETHSVIRKFQETGKIDSPYLTDEEKAYLEDNVEKIDMHLDMQEEYSVAIFTKK